MCLSMILSSHTESVTLGYFLSPMHFLTIESNTHLPRKKKWLLADGHLYHIFFITAHRLQQFISPARANHFGSDIFFLLFLLLNS